jgi:hypothetical protein
MFYELLLNHHNGTRPLPQNITLDSVLIELGTLIYSDDDIRILISNMPELMNAIIEIADSSATTPRTLVRELRRLFAIAM